MLGIVNDPQMFLAGLALGALVGIVIERYLLEPLAQLKAIEQRVRRRGR